MPYTVDPGELTNNMLGQRIRITWPGAANGHTAIVEGAILGVSHGTRGTNIEVDLGVTHIRFDPYQLTNATVERL